MLFNCGEEILPDYTTRGIDIFTTEEGLPYQPDLEDILDFWIIESAEWENISESKSKKIVAAIVSITATKKELITYEGPAAGIYDGYMRIFIHWIYECLQWKILFHELMHHFLLEQKGNVDQYHNKNPNAWNKVQEFYNQYVEEIGCVNKNE